MFALEFILSMCECAPEMLRKFMAPIETVMRTAAEFASYMKDDPEWYKKDDDLNNLQSFGDDDTDDGTAMAALGDDALDRIATAIGGRLTVRAWTLVLLCEPALNSVVICSFAFVAFMPASASSQRCRPR